MKALVDGDIVGKTWKDKNGYLRHGNDLYVHRTIAEKDLGRKLLTKEVVHHLNYDKEDNRPSNLLVCANQKRHKLIHALQDCINAGFDPLRYALCSLCQDYKPKEEFAKSKKRWNGLHNLCKYHSNKYRQEKKYNVGKWSEKLKLQQQIRRAAKKSAQGRDVGCAR